MGAPSSVASQPSIGRMAHRLAITRPPMVSGCASGPAGSTVGSKGNATPSATRWAPKSDAVRNVRTWTGRARRINEPFGI